MNIKDGYISKKITYDTQDSLDEKIDRLESMVSKLTAQDDDQNKKFKPKIYTPTQFFMITAMVRKIIKIDIDQIVEIGEYDLVAEYNMDRTVEKDQGIIRIIEVTLEGEILEGMSNQIGIIEVKIIEMDIKEIIEIIVMKEAEVCIGIDNIPIIEVTVETTVDLGQVQEPVQREIKLDVINTGNMIILLKIA